MTVTMIGQERVATLATAELHSPRDAPRARPSARTVDALPTLLRAMARESHPVSAASVLTEKLVLELGAVTAVVYFADADGRTLRLAASTNLPATCGDLDVIDIARSSLPAARAARTRALQLVGNANRPCPHTRDPRSLARTVVGVAFALPLLVGDRLLGAVTVQLATGIEPWDLEALESLGVVLGVVLDRARLEEEARARDEGMRVVAHEHRPRLLLRVVLWRLRRAIAKGARHAERRQLGAHDDQPCAEAHAVLKRYEEVRSDVSHDLRSPLGVIHLCAQRLLKLLPTIASETRTVAETILRAVARSNDLVENLLDEARLRGDGMTLERRDHAIDDLLDDVRDLRRLAVQRGIVLNVEPAHTPRHLLCDRAKMAQVFSNLVGNAIKFSPHGSTVKVWTDNGERAVRFAVSDTGPGIEPEARPHLFERFWRSRDRKVPGIGLGLYIAKGIMDAHGGHLWVETHEGSGSTFFVSVPTG